MSLNKTLWSNSVDPNGPPAPQTYYEPPRKHNGCMWAAIGCGTVLLLFAIALTVAGIYVARNAKKFAADGVTMAADQIISESKLPPNQKKRILARITSLADDFKEGDLTLDELGEIIERMSEDKSLVAGGLMYVIENHLLNDPSIDEAQRTAMQRELQRVSRGVIEGDIELDALEDLANEFLEPEGPNGNREVKSDISSEDVDAIIKKAQELADEAAVPDEPYEIDIAAEFEKIIDDVLGGMPQETSEPQDEDTGAYEIKIE